MKDEETKEGYTFFVFELEHRYKNERVMKKGKIITRIRIPAIA